MEKSADELFHAQCWQTYFKSFAAFTPQDFENMLGHFSALCMKSLK